MYQDCKLTYAVDNIDAKRTALVTRVDVALEERYNDLCSPVVAATQVANLAKWPLYSKGKEGIRGCYNLDE